MSHLDTSMLELFKLEVETQTASLSKHLLALETQAADSAVDTSVLEALMRAAHSIKGAGRMLAIDSAVQVAHHMEDLFVAAQRNELRLQAEHIDILLRGVDLLQDIAAQAVAGQKVASATIDNFVAALAELRASSRRAAAPSPATTAPSPATHPPQRTSTSRASAPAMLDLFRAELDSQLKTLAAGLLALEQDPNQPQRLEALMRAAHSIKGAARIVDLQFAVQIAHAMEEDLVAAQRGQLRLTSAAVDLLLRAVDTLSNLGASDDIPHWCSQHAEQIEALETQLLALPNTAPHDPARQPVPEPIASEPIAPAPREEPTPAKGPADSAIRVSAESLNRLLGLAGEVQVEARWLRPYADSLVQFKHRHTELISLLDKLRDALQTHSVDEYVRNILHDAQHKAAYCRQALAQRLTELDEYERRSHNLAARLNREVIASRMRPFADAVQGFQRMVRDLARSLGKQVRLDIRGLATQVDRDILEKIEAPLNHLLRNAVDHGIETPTERLAAGKPASATLRLEAMHSAGMLSIVVEDDGRGMQLDQLREKIVQKQLVSAQMAAELSEAELMDFLFLPGFSTRDQVTEISGRGVGLDVVHSVVQEMHGIVHALAQPGRGMRFHMQLPLTLSVMRTLMVEISAEPYAFPLAQIHRTFTLPRAAIETMEGRQYFTLGNQHIGLIAANQVLGLPNAPPQQDDVAIVVLGERLQRFGLVVDRFLGERSLAVQALDPRLGKIQDINAAAILENGEPCLIVDVDDLLRSIDILIAGGRLDKINRADSVPERKAASKRILVVDDSITVREVERNMLTGRGYQVDVAVDGIDGWNAVRTGQYDLIISDIDMPRMNGFEFVELIKKDPHLKTLPVMIVSYKDRPEDRNRGLEAGADYYLTKGSFHDETLLDAVADLIGPAADK